MEVHEWLGTVLASIAAIGVAWLTARGSTQAATAKAEVDVELGNAQLALQVAQEVRAELVEARAELSRVKADQRECHALLDDLKAAWRKQMGTEFGTPESH